MKKVNAQTIKEKENIAMGNEFYLQKNYDKATSYYSNALIKNPNQVKANYNLGNTFFEQKKYDKAATHFKRAAQHSKDKNIKALAFHNLGNAKMQQQKYKEAAQAYKNSLKNNPKDNQTRYNFALAKKLINKKQDKNNPPDLPKPSEFAKQQKQKADEFALKGSFKSAKEIMENALKKDTTVLHFRTYMDKLAEVVMIDTIE